MNGLKVSNRKNRFIYYHIVQIGAGANGSHFFRSLLQDIATYGKGDERINFTLTIVDRDKVEKKNLSNQLYDDDDIDSYKVDALGERYGDHYGFDINCVPEYVTDLDMLNKLFTLPYFPKGYDKIPILIGQVDNNRTRQLLDEFFHSDYLEDLVYIDAGVEGVTIIPNKKPYQYTSQEKNMVEESGFSGQVVAGYKKRNQVWLPPVGRVYEDILSDELTSFPEQSCGDAIINNPQRCATNKFAAQITNNIMNNIFHNQMIYTHVLNFNAQVSGVNPTYVSKEIQKEFQQTYKGEDEK